MSLKNNNFKKTISIITLVTILILPSSLSHAALGDRALSAGINHIDVKTLQTHLKDMGYFKYNSNTTYFGRLTMEAVMDFQAKNKLVVDGSFGPASFKVLQTLLKNDNKLPESKPSGDEVFQIIYKKPLFLGSKGEDVKSFQEALKTLGFLKIDKTTTYFGSITEKALIDFQVSLNILPDGRASSSTYQAINKALKDNFKISMPNRGEVDRLTMDIITIAKSYLDPKVPYVFGGNSIEGMDCSAFTMSVYGQAGIKIPRTSDLQAGIGREVNRNNLKAGDLLIFSDTYRAGPSHVGIYLGNQELIHASTSNNGTTISKLTSKYYEDHFTFGRRLY